MTGQASGRERIGLLMVHGMGEQKPFEHLKATVTQFAELLRQLGEGGRVSVVDRTGGWTLAAGDPEVAGPAPMTISYISPGRQVDFECHEVFWADLGAPSGLWDQFTFWIWGLGEWNAPIYLDMDASRMNAERKQHRSVPPKSVAGDFRYELRARFRLQWAGLVAFFTLFSWSLAKRVFSAALGSAPSPSLIEQYVGDVRLYTERAVPGGAHPGDPGMPLRVAIRRRMIAQMVAMSARCARGDYQGWHLVAHSLGTVVAYNGLTEIGHTLPNYLPQSLWQQVRSHFSDLGASHKTPLRKNVGDMMPARPAWLGKGDVINRQKLFAHLRSVLTYGSPLSKFAGLWPRIVATSPETAESNPFGKNHPGGKVPWINLVAPTDPVAGLLEPFGPKSPLADMLPVLETHVTPCEPFFPGLAHLRYFQGGERHRTAELAPQQRLWVMRRLLGEKVGAFPPEERPLPKRVAALSYLVASLILMVAASLLYGLFFAGLNKLRTHPVDFQLWSRDGMAEAFGVTVTLALAAIALAGLWRWARESQFNYRLAAFDGLTQPEKKIVAEQLLRWQAWAGWTIFVIGVCAIGLAALEVTGVVHVTRVLPGFPILPGWLKPLLAMGASAAMMLIAALAQIAINRRWRVGNSKGKWGSAGN